MKQTIDTLLSPASSHIPTIENHLSNVEYQNQKIELYKVGTALGLHEMQASLFATDVLNKAGNYYMNSDGRMPKRILLIQMMVHKSLFHISSGLCLQSFGNVNSDTYNKPRMPLSFWAVYVLHHSFCLSFIETAFILNTTLSEVKIRWNKALEYNYKPQ
jgi:hypothetical protein